MMEDIQCLYRVVFDEDVLPEQHNHEIRHIAFYLWELFFKEYKELKTEKHVLHRECEDARIALQQLVDHSTTTSMGNLRCLESVMTEIRGSIVTVEEIRSISANVSSPNVGNVIPFNYVAKMNISDEDQTDTTGDLNAVVHLYREILKIDNSEKIPLLLEYEQLIDELSNVENLYVIQLLKNGLIKVKKQLEDSLYGSFSNNINSTLKIFKDINRLSASSSEEIARGYVANRNTYIIERLTLVKSLMRENVHRGLQELTITLKTTIYSILSCYKVVFGSVDDGLVCHMRKIIFQFLSILKGCVVTCRSTMMPKYFSDVRQEMSDIAKSFEPYGISFLPLLHDIFQM